MQTWVMVGNWRFLDEAPPEALLDRLQAAGVTTVAFGAAPPIVPDPAHYPDSPVVPVPPPPATMAYAQRVHRLIDTAVSRGIQVHLYGANPHMSGVAEVYQQLGVKHVLPVDGGASVPVRSYWGACMNGTGFLDYYSGRLRDAAAAFPGISGFLNDGPEFGYEIAPGFMDDNLSVFSCFGPCCQNAAAWLGYDFDGLRQAAVDLRAGLHRLTASSIAAAIAQPGSPAEALAVAAGVPGVVPWLSFKADSVASYVEHLAAAVHGLDGDFTLGVGSRLPAFSTFTGYALDRVAQLADFILPKIVTIQLSRR